MYFAVHRKGLVVCREGGRLRVPNGAEVSAVCGPASAHYLGTLDEVNVFAVASLDEMPAPFEVVNLRGLYGDLDHAGLRLITCGGRFSRAARSYDDNVIAYAELVRTV